MGGGAVWGPWLHLLVLRFMQKPCKAKCITRTRIKSLTRTLLPSYRPSTSPHWESAATSRLFPSAPALLPGKSAAASRSALRAGRERAGSRWVRRWALPPPGRSGALRSTRQQPRSRRRPRAQERRARAGAASHTPRLSARSHQTKRHGPARRPPRTRPSARGEGGGASLVPALQRTYKAGERPPTSPFPAERR